MYRALPILSKVQKKHNEAQKQRKKRKILKIWCHFDETIIISKIWFIILCIIMQNTVFIVSYPHIKFIKKLKTP